MADHVSVRVAHLLVFGCVLGLLLAPSGETSASTGFPPAERIGLRAAEIGELAVVRASDQDRDGVTVEFLLPALIVQPVEIDGETYHVFEIESGGAAGQEGAPMLPTFTRLVSIPARSGVSFEVLEVETTELYGYRPFPMQPEQSDRFILDQQAYSLAGYPQAERVALGEPALLRDLRVVPISFSPLRYDPARDAVEIATRIRVRVHFAEVDLRNANTRAARPVSPSYDRLCGRLVANYESDRSGENSLGCDVIICPDNAEVVAALQPLVQWRTRKGFEVHLATTAQTGTSNYQIRNWLQNAYDTWENPPEFVTLVGDATGSIMIPAWGNSDLSYVLFSGGDALPDAHIGRISVENVDILQLYVNKIVGYESTPYMQDPEWYSRACLVGDPGGCGIPCVQCMQWLKNRMVEWGYTRVDTIFASPFSSQMTTSLNRGVSAFAYRGYIGMSGFTNGNIYALTNGWKLCYAVNITCETGSFESTTSISEAWIRAGIAPSTPTGGIASIGTATSGTHSRYNNCVQYGVWRGMFDEGLHTFGETLTRGKTELWLNYYPWDGAVTTWLSYNNLMGDPAGELWTTTPQEIAVSHPSSIAVGTNAVTVSVTHQGVPQPGAYVCLWKGSETHTGGYTGTDGTVELAVNASTTGEMLITVTGHDLYPYQAAIPVSFSAHFASYREHAIDDDLGGTSSGNGNGVLNPAEHIELPVQIRNFGADTLTGVTATLTCDDPYVTISDGDETYPDLPPGTSAWSLDDFDLTLAGGAPCGHVVRLDLDIHSGADTWRSAIDIPVSAAAFAYDHVTLYNMGATIDPGDAGEISVAIRNIGDAQGTSVTGTLSTQDRWLTITDAAGSYGNIGIGALGENTTNRFGVSAAADCYPGHLVELTLALQFSNGARDTVRFVLTIGVAVGTNPTGPDDYGYYAFDNTDTSYPEAPAYDWIEIAPNHGGPGTDLGLQDFGDNNDDICTVDLPFAFQFYGETFTRASICSNGWLSMGSTYVAHQLNWNIPAAGAPDYLIAAMWDDLHQNGDDHICHWYDEPNHRYIVEWPNVVAAEGGGISNFEILLYDPLHHPTISGDGIIVIQYDSFNNTDYIQQYSTIGIENGDQTDGVLYGYYNSYTAGAATITHGRAIKFIALEAAPRGIVTGTITNATNGGTPLAGATIELAPRDLRFTSEADGTYRGSVPVGVYSLTASHPSFAPQTVSNIWVTAGQTTVIDFSLNDIMPPVYLSTTDLPNTADEDGPYVVSTNIAEYSALTLSLFYNVRGMGWLELPMTDSGDGVYSAEIPGQSQGSLIKYYIRGEDVGGLAATDPAQAPWETYEFWVVAPIFSDNLEAGAGEWIHYAVIDTLTDQWHLSTARNHTPDGLQSWGCNDPGAGTYADLANGGLESEPVVLSGESSLTFWHWMDAEVSGAHQGYAYDGGFVELSLDGGPWTQITPVGGYPYRVRAGSIPGPFAAETPIFSGTHDWEEVTFALGELAGTARFRFQFGSDGAVVREGWYIDDVTVVSSDPGASSTEDHPRALPTALALHAGRPNPFGSSSAQTTVVFDLPRATRVTLDVFDVGGRRIEQLVNRTLEPGRYEIAWDGRDARGQAVDGGAYFCVMQAENRRLMQRVLVVR